MPKHRIKLKKTIIAVLKENGDRPLSAEQLMHLCESRLAPNYLPCNNNAMGQILRQLQSDKCKAINSVSTILTSGQGNSYVSAVYSLESEEAFNEWLEKVC